MSLWWLVVCLAIFFIGVAKSGFGSGVGLMIVPTAMLAMRRMGYPPQATLGLMLPLLILGDIIAVWQYRSSFSTRIVARLVPGSIAGVFVGWLLLNWFNAQKQSVAIGLVEIEVGLESVCLVGLQWWRVLRGSQGAFSDPRMVRSSATGAAAGVSSTLAHAAGPIIALYLLPQKLDRAVFVGTSAVYFFLLNASKLPAYWSSHDMNRATFAMSARTFPLVVAGALFGVWLNRRMNDRIFSQVIYAATFVLGGYLLIIGAQAMTRV